jgi:hypothetical protein
MSDEKRVDVPPVRARRRRLGPRLARAAYRRALPAALRAKIDHQIAANRSIVPLSARLYVRRRLHRGALLPYLETHLTDHCNLACRGCDHYSPLSPPAFASLEVFERDIARLSELFARISTIQLLGGEPLLHPDVLGFARAARTAFPSARLLLLTNGVLVPKMSEEFWSRLASLRLELNVSAYPVAVDYELIGRTAAGHGVPVRFHRRKEFARMPVREAGDRDAQGAFDACRPYMNCPLLRDGRIFPCARIPYVGLLAERFDASMPVGENDSIDIYRETDGYRIARFLQHPVPWCSHCDPEAIESFPWAPSRFQSEEWGLIPAQERFARANVPSQREDGRQ